MHWRGRENGAQLSPQKTAAHGHGVASAIPHQAGLLPLAPEALGVARLDVPAGATPRSDRDYLLRRILVAVDVAALLIGTATLAVTGEMNDHLASRAAWILATIPVWLLLFLMYGLYSSGLRRVGHSTVDDLPGLAHVFLLGGVAMWLYLELTPDGAPLLTPTVMFIAVTAVADLTLRTLARRLSIRVLGKERVLFVGSGPMTPVLVRQLLRRNSHGLELVGALTRPENREWPLPIPGLGELGEADSVALLLASRIERVVVSAEGVEDATLLQLVDSCRRLAIKVSLLPSLAAMIGPAATIDQLEGITVIGLNLPTLARSSELLKRGVDIVGASMLLILSAPVWLIAAIAIKLDSPGPVLFRQERIGRGGRPFRLAKFRTMVADAEERRQALLERSRQPGWLDLSTDPRITRVGRWLRLTSVDEIPQLWSVLRGQMSLVGPRPLIAQEDANISGWARGRLDLTPGLTGTWQVLGRTHIPFEQMVIIDYLYVANWSLWTDVKLMLRTLPAVLRRDGAN